MDNCYLINSNRNNEQEEMDKYLNYGAVGID